LNSKVFGTDLSAVAAAYMHWRLPCLGSRRRYIIPLFRRKPPGPQKPVQEKRMKGSNQTIVRRTQSYEPISPTPDRYSSMATFRRIWRMGKLNHHWQVVKTHADAICTGPRSKEKRREKQETSKRSRPPYLHFRTHTPTTIIPVACISV